jgi:hypothetical protein
LIDTSILITKAEGLSDLSPASELEQLLKRATTSVGWVLSVDACGEQRIVSIGDVVQEFPRHREKPWIPWQE